MRIALTLSKLPLSGVGTSVAIIHDGLVDAGYDVDVIITGHEAVADARFAQESNWALKTPGLGIRFLPERLKLLVDCINHSNYDFVLNNLSMEIQLILPCLNRKIFQISVLRTLNKKAIKQISINSQYLDSAVAISKEMAREMEREAKIVCPVRLISNCTRAKGGEFPSLSTPLRLCYVGRLNQADKNVMILPKIANSLLQSGTQFTLDVIGDGPDFHKLKKQFDRFPDSTIKMRGQLPREEASRQICNSHFVILPSAFEGLSNVMMEAMAFGCVPIVSDIENFKWVLGDAADTLQCGLHSAQYYSERIISLSREKEKYKAVQELLRKRQLEMFTPESTIHGYINLLDELKSSGVKNSHKEVPIQDLRMPLRFKIYCSPVWQLFQNARNVIR